MIEVGGAPAYGGGGAVVELSGEEQWGQSSVGQFITHFLSIDSTSSTR